MDSEKASGRTGHNLGELDNFCFTPCHILIVYFFFFYFLSLPHHDRQKKVTNLLIQTM